MMRVPLLSVVVACCAVAPAAAELRTLLPATAPGNTAVRVGRIAEYDATTLSTFIDGGAEVFLDYGFVRAATAEYGSGDAEVICTVYEMSDSQAAFGVFSYFRGTLAEGRSEIGDGAFGSDLQLAFWQNRYFATIERFSTDARNRDVLSAFARAISGRIDAHAALPAIFDRLPADRSKGSERLLRGRAARNALYAASPSTEVSFGGGEVLAAAQYSVNGRTVTLWLVPFQDVAALDRTFPTRDHKLEHLSNGSVTLVRRVGAALVIVSGAKSAEDASALAERVRP